MQLQQGITISDEQAEEIATAAHGGNYDDERTHTYEILANETFQNFDAIVNAIMDGDTERLDQEWGLGSLQRNKVISSVARVLHM